MEICFKIMLGFGFEPNLERVGWIGNPSEGSIEYFSLSTYSQANASVRI